MATLSDAFWATEGMEVTVVINHPFSNLISLHQDDFNTIELICASHPKNPKSLYKTCLEDLVKRLITFPESYTERCRTMVRGSDGYDYQVKLKDLENYTRSLQ